MAQQRTFIATTSLEGMRPLAFQGVQAIACHAQLASLLEGQRAPDLAAFLAEPLIDQAQESADWYTPASAPLRRLSTLPEAEQRVLRAKIAEIATRIQTLAHTLQQAPDSNSKMAGSLLELALSYPSEECLYCTATGDPVLICWGCAPGNVAAAPEALVRMASVAPLQPPPPRPATPPPVETPAAAVETPSAPPPLPPSSPVAAAPTPRRSTWPWWILFFLLGFLLCALIMPWLLPRLGLPSVTLDFLPGGCSAPPPTVTVQTPVPEGLGFSQDKEKALRDELNRLRQSYLDRLQTCPPKAAKIEPPVEQPKPPEQPSKLEIPETPTDLAFLEGCWMAGEEMLVNSRTKLPVAVKFCFDKDGKGDALVQEFDAKGKKVKECKGKATATLKPPNILIIDDKGSIVCPGGAKYERTQATCINKDNVAVCSRPKYDDIPFTRTTR